MKLRYRVINALEGVWLEMERWFLALVIKVLPKFEPEDPEMCEHKWLVDGVDYPSVSLRLVCWNCRSNGVVVDPTEQEWNEAYGASMKNYEWHDHQRATWLNQWED